MKYKSTLGGIEPVPFDQAILEGFAADGGLFVPETIPRFSPEELQVMATMEYMELAETILRKFIDPEIIPTDDLRELLAKSFATFESNEIIPVVRFGSSKLYIQELFHGPTLSFKDIAMGFLINCMDYFLTQKNEKLSLILATTGDTGPAAAWAAAGKDTLECWPLYPKGMISEEQERQMTTLEADNVHPVGVTGCKNGGDDLDVVVAKLFGDRRIKKELKLSSVNSINWCRVMVQTIHYFHGYFQVAEEVGEEVVFSVPAGAFGNLCAGFIARSMGLPVKKFVCATNENGTLYRVFEKGYLSQEELITTCSSAIDILVPYNFWRFLYFSCGEDTGLLHDFMQEFSKHGLLRFPTELWQQFRTGFVATTISDEETLATIATVYAQDAYLLDPHGAVAVAAAWNCLDSWNQEDKVVCLATAHPAKFPDVIGQVFQRIPGLELSITHPSIEAARERFHHLRTCSYDMLEPALVQAIRNKI